MPRPVIDRLELIKVDAGERERSADRSRAHGEIAARLDGRDDVVLVTQSNHRERRMFEASVAKRARAAARAATFDFIEVFYNRQRLHSSLGYLSPKACARTLTTSCFHLSTESGQAQAYD